MGRVPSWRVGDGGVEGGLEGDGGGVDVDIFAESEDEEDLDDASNSKRESQLWDLARFLLTSMLSDFAVVSNPRDCTEMVKSATPRRVLDHMGTR